MISRFFIERPIFSAVVSIVIVLAGGVTLTVLPIAQYPEITPPTVKVSAVYPGANAKTLSETVATPIEQEVNGVENMLYMSSTSTNDGSYNLTVTFKVGTDLDMAQVLVQNRVAIATPKLPEEVKRQGVNTKKQSTNIILFISLTSDNPEHDDLFLTNYLYLNIRDQMSRIEGVGDAQIFGAEYGMRVWLDPNKLKALKLTTQDVVNAIREQNVQVAAGQIGQPPVPDDQTFQLVINTLGRLKTKEQFENIILPSPDKSKIIRVKNVARVELGAKDYNFFPSKGTKIEGVPGRDSTNPAGLLAIYQLPGANALEVADRVQAKMKELSRDFPQGMKYEIPYDTTRFVKASIEEVYSTLFQAGLLVFLTIFIFLQDWRATLIPGLTIPVSLVGTFAVMALFGFSINMLTLFGLVLAIGIVVDDAVVIVENTSRHMDDGGMDSKSAAIKTMNEVTGPVIATSLVLLAVFVPAAFMPGITGQLYRQFALTIAAATVFSTINALTLSPMMCALILRPSAQKKDAVFHLFNYPIFRPFNFLFGGAESGYRWFVRRIVRVALLVMVVYFGLVAFAGWSFASLPTGFLPIEDQGYVMASIQLPDAASLERTKDVLEKVNDALGETPGVKEWVSVAGYSVLDSANASNAAAVWIIMEPWEERTDPSLSQPAILANLYKRFAEIQDAVIITFPPPAINGLGVSGGFQMQLQARGGTSLQELQQVTQEMIEAGNSQSGLTGLNTTFRANVPQLFIDVNRNAAKTLNVPLSNIFDTLQAYLGSTYVNDFNKFGRTYQVRVQADSSFRLKAEDIQRLDVGTADGKTIPLGSLVSVRKDFGPQLIVRYNLYPSAAITGQAAPGHSSGEALSLMEQMADAQLPTAMGYEWTGMSFQEKQVGSEAILIFALAIILVFLVLAAQYESWTSPAAIILAVPLSLLGVVGALVARGMDNNVYTQIGIVLLIALASKNAILIVEFARDIRRQGKSITESAIESSQLRFRPILMTSISSLLGFFPLVIAFGAGAASRQAMGTVVVGGMFAATFLTIIFVPVFFIVFQWLEERLFRAKVPALATPGSEAADTPSSPQAPDDDDTQIISPKPDGVSGSETHIMPQENLPPQRKPTEENPNS